MVLEHIKDPNEKFDDILHDLGCLLNKNECESDYWKLIFPQVIALIDYFYVIFDKDNDIKYTQYTKVKRYASKLYSRYKGRAILKYIYIKNAQYTIKFFKGNQSGNRENIFIRDTIQHGVYNPRNYTYKQLVQLILRLSSLSDFCNDLEYVRI